MTLDEIQTQGYVQNRGIVEVKGPGQGWGLLWGAHTGVEAGTPPGA